MGSTGKNIVAYPAWIYLQKETTVIDIPDFEMHIEETKESLGEAMENARNQIKQRAEQLKEEGMELPEPNSIDYKKSKGAVFTYIDVNYDMLFNKKKTLDELSEEDESRINTMCEVGENVIEFLKGKKVMSVTFSQLRLTNKIIKLSGKYPDEVKVIRKNLDGSIYAKLPVNYLHIYKPGSGPKKEYTEEERVAFRERVTRKNEEDLHTSDI